MIINYLHITAYYQGTPIDSQLYSKPIGHGSSNREVAGI